MPINIDPPPVADESEARKLCFHHLTLAVAYYEATNYSSIDIHNYVRREIDNDGAKKAIHAFFRELDAYYDSIELE